MEVLLLVITGIAILLLGTTLILVYRSQSEASVKVTLGQVLMGVLMFSIGSFIGTIMPRESGLVCQISGSLVNMGMLVFPFAVILRYVYFFSVVVMERPAVGRRWAIVTCLFWMFAVVLSSILGEFELYRAEDGIPYCMARFSSQHAVDIVNSATCAILMALGGIVHSISSFFILAKSQVNQQKSYRSRHRSAVLKKYIPVVVLYQATHIPFIIFVVYQALSATSLPPLANNAYAFIYAVCTLLTPIVVLLTNANLYHDYKLHIPNLEK